MNNTKKIKIYSNNCIKKLHKKRVAQAKRARKARRLNRGK